MTRTPLTALLIQSGTIRPVAIATRPGQQQYQAIQQTLGVHTFDVVGLEHGIDLFVDDEGAVNGSPLNLAATVLAHTLGTPAVLFGPALALSVDQAGATTGLTPDQARISSHAATAPPPAVLAAVTRTLRAAGIPLPR